MPANWLNESEQQRFTSYLAHVSENDTVTFTLTDTDWQLLKKLSGKANPTWFALPLATRRFLGFVPEILQKLKGS